MRFKSGRNETALEVVDATEPMSFMLKEGDANGAICRSPSSCIFAKALHRNKSILEAQVGAGVAMVRFADTPEVWTRYQLRGREKRMTAVFDEHDVTPSTGAMMEGNSVTFHPFTEGSKVGQRRRLTERSTKREGLKSSVYRRHLAIEPAA